MAEYGDDIPVAAAEISEETRLAIHQEGKASRACKWEREWYTCNVTDLITEHRASEARPTINSEISSSKWRVNF